MTNLLRKLCSSFSSVFYLCDKISGINNLQGGKVDFGYCFQPIDIWFFELIGSAL